MRSLRLLLLLASLVAAACAEDPGPPIVGGGAGAAPGGDGGATGGAGGLPDGGGGAGGLALDLPLVSPIALYVQPDADRDFLLDAFRGAARSIRVVSYLLTDDETEAALIAAASRGVDVRVIVEGSQASNADARLALARGGVQVREGDPRFALTHQKSVVIDDVQALVMTQNLTMSGFDRNREYIALFTGSVAEELAAVFDADWSRGGFTAETSLVLSPVNSRFRLESLLLAARHELLVTMEVFNDDHVREVLVRRAREGVRVAVVLEDPSDIPEHREVAAELGAVGGEVRWLATPEVHAKAIVADGSVAYLGSINFTAASMDRNREVGILTDDAAAVARIAAQIEADLAAGSDAF